jgi:putative tryptophan/tyrosine transport system substrate-binding protein
MRQGWRVRGGIRGWCLVAAVVLAAAAARPATAAERRVGILLWNAQPRYEHCRDGLLEVLRAEGFTEPGTTFVVEQAYGSRTAVREAAHKLAQAHLTLVVAIGTSAAVAVAEEVKEVPVVFAMVFDPVASGIARDWSSSGNNTTGASSKTSAPRLLDALRQITTLKRLGVLYTPGEKNSEAQVRELVALGKSSDFEVVSLPLASRVEVVPTLAHAAGTVEAVVLTGSSVVGDMVGQIVALASKAKIVTATQSDDHVDKGVLVGVTVDPGAVGRLAGDKAAKVLRGAPPASIPIEALKASELVLNLKTAKATGIEVPVALRKAAVRVIE